MILKLISFKRKKHAKSHKTTFLSKFINTLNRKGFKSYNTNLLLNSLNYLKIETKESPILQLDLTLRKIKPLVELKSVTVGSTKYLTPTPLTESKQQLIALKILIKNAKNRPERTSLSQKLALEIYETNLKTSETFKQIDQFLNLVNENIQNSRFSKFPKLK